ncbi:FHA domain-containing protein [Tautonia marina]|uniref:FHA domain-containing protein n=1 Tax=Tautonia marina TaxID=2653855 RepID=UPI0012612FD1
MMNGPPESNNWLLEVVRGRDVGRRYPLRPGRVVLGNAPGEAEGLDLSEQEANSPRKMMGRHAAVELSRSGLVLMDLESPGGVFLNRRRVLSGQAQPLSEGDVLQLGGVQLRVVVENPKITPTSSKAPSQGVADRARPEEKGNATPIRRPAEPPRPSRGPVAPLAFALKNGPVCRSWDDFITVSAQRWEGLREELTSGRLASYLISVGRSEMAPRADAPGSPDDRLDAWLNSIPTSKPSHPELEVHPRSVRVRATPGATTRQAFRVSNIGFRLLRSTLKVEPEGLEWLTITPEFDREFTTIDETEVSFTIVTPDPFPGRLDASIGVESNGGMARVAVVVESPSPRVTEPSEPFEGQEQGNWSPEVLREGCAAWLARRGGRSRIVGGAAIAMLLRLGIGAASGFSSIALLPGPAAVLAVLGGILGGMGCVKRGGIGDVVPGVFSGSFAGMLMAAFLVAMCQAVEPLFGGSISSNLVAVVMIWGVLGAVVGAGSLWTVPDGRRTQGGTS